MTEKEILQIQKRQIYTIDKLLNQELISLSDLDEILPALVHINSPVDSSLLYVSKAGTDFLRMEKEELLPASPDQLAEINSPETLAHVTPRFVEFYKEEDFFKVISAFQQVKQRGKEGYTWVYTTTKIYQKLQAPISISIPLPQMGQIAGKMEGLLEDNLFMKKNYQKFASLSKREMEIMKLVAKGLKRSEIADMLSISIHTYDTHRKNIRNKLELTSFSELIKYARAFGLII
ncbi:helix-turn-helix transcriptional regulator [bacterium]|nr:helix-turn-helix transcriptional regulator [bacterium]